MYMLQNSALLSRAGSSAISHHRSGPRSINVSSARVLVQAPRTGSDVRMRAADEKALDIRTLSNLISTQAVDGEQRESIEALAAVFDVPIAQVKAMAFKRRGLLSITPEEVKTKIHRVAEVIEVPYETAKQMVIIQPGLLFDTDKQADTLKYGIKSICYELNASKDEVVELVLKNQSVLHGRELRLSVADVAHLAMLREPKGRIVD